MAYDTLDNISRAICGEYLGFFPVTNSTKPPHIANGLFRSCAGETCCTRDIHEWIISDGRRNAISSEEIISKYKALLRNGEEEKSSNISELRLLLDEIFDQDNAVYPNYEFSVMTISSHWLIKKKLKPEGGIGEFIFKILAKQIDGKRSPVIALLQEALKDDSDDITKLVKPIIAFPSENEKRSVSGVICPEDFEISWDSVKQSIRNGFDCLAANIKNLGENKNSLTVLKRIVSFSIFSTFLYLTQCNHALYNGIKPLIVFDAVGNLESIKKASELSYISAKKSVEDFYVNSIKKYLRPTISSDSVKKCKEWIDSMIFSDSAEEDNIKHALLNYFTSFYSENNSALHALSRALQLVLYTFVYKNNSPSDFCRVLGVRAGLIGPKGNRAKAKRYLLNSFTLETIALSTLAFEELKEGIELKLLGEKLFSAYNILIGADAENDFKLLERHNISQSAPGDLRGALNINAQQLGNIFISLGLGKKYADGITLVGRGL